MSSNYLREMAIGVDFDIDYRELRKADDAVDDLTDETRRSTKEMDRLNDQTKRTSSTFKKMGTAIGAVGGLYALGSGLKEAISKGAAFEEQTAKFNTVFKQFSDEARNWAQEYSDQVGRSAIETQGFLSANQSMLVGFGASRKEAFEFSKDIQELSVDLASFNNMQDEVAANNIKSVLLGQHQAGKKLDLAINENVLSQLALKEGYEKSYRQLKPLQKMQLRYKAMVNQSQDAMGDAERTLGSYTNQKKEFLGIIEEATTAAGMELIPTLRGLITTVNDNEDAIKDFIIGGVKLASGAIDGMIGVVNFAIDSYERFSPLILGVGSAFLYMKTQAAISGTITGVTYALKGMTVMAEAGTIATYANAAAQKALGAAAILAQGPMATLNAIMAMSPFGAVALGIGVVVTALAVFKDKIEWVGWIWDHTLGALWDKIKEFGSMFMNGEDSKLTIEERKITENNKNVNTKDTSSRNKYAIGTNYASKGLAEVGENGRELVMMSGGEKVFTNYETKRLIDKNTFNEDTQKINYSNENKTVYNNTKELFKNINNENKTEKILNRISTENNKTTKTSVNSNNENNFTFNIYESDNPKETGEEVETIVDNYFSKMGLKGGY
ncbi:MAG: hypothetical protein K9L56_13290 [Clostridiales bacterium]|nr:hypothetical protein [Clostridiales bacterium]